jgi:hypothetical protein
VATIDGDLKRAATLVGAANAHRHDQPEDPDQARLHTTFIQRARDRSAKDEWDAALNWGTALSFEDAIAYAVQEPRGEISTPHRTGSWERQNSPPH